MRIRDVRADDFERIVEINNANLPAVTPTDVTEVIQYQAQAHTFAVVESDDVVAFLIGLPGPGLEYDSLNYQWFCQRYERFLYVDRIVVADGVRSAGLGKQLYDHFAERGRTDGYAFMLAEVNVRPPNPGSLRFHERYGFTRVGEQDTENGKKRVALLEKRLAGPL